MQRRSFLSGARSLPTPVSSNVLARAALVRASSRPPGLLRRRGPRPEGHAGREPAPEDPRRAGIQHARWANTVDMQRPSSWAPAWSVSPLSQLARRRESTRRELLFSPWVEDACGLRRRLRDLAIQGEPCCARDAR